MGFPKRLLIAGRVAHYLHDGRLYAYTPYVREIDLWADLFEDVAIAGTLRHQSPPGDCSPFGRTNIRVIGVCEAGGDGFKAKILQVFALPAIIRQLVTCMRNADAIHARCPSDLGLLVLFIAPFFTRHLIAKYAGQWTQFPGEPLAWRLQRALLRSNWWRGPVTVYTPVTGQPSKIVPFFTSMLTDEQIGRARVAAVRPRDDTVFSILFVGRLSAARNVDVLLKAVRKLRINNNRRIECVIVGEGPENAALQKLASDLGITDRIRFLGGLPFDDVLSSYASANVLVLAADSEGWGKAITEGMAFGCVCIGSNRGVMPMILGDGRGLLVAPRDVQALQNALQYVAEHPTEAAEMSERSAQWAQKFSLEGLRDALRELMLRSWNDPAQAEPSPQMAFLK